MRKYGMILAAAETGMMCAMSPAEGDIEQSEGAGGPDAANSVVADAVRDSRQPVPGEYAAPLLAAAEDADDESTDEPSDDDQDGDDDEPLG